VTALAVTGAIAAAGAAEVGNAVIAVLYDVATGIGALVMLGAAVWGLLCALGWRQRRTALRTPTQPNPVFDAYQRDECPWCDTHACIDSTLCNCETACGSWLCEAKEASRG
jgi:hypothetical protein